MVQTAGDVLYIPVGWVCAEMCTKGLLVYGVRRAFITRSDRAASSYEELIGTYANEKREVTRMKAAVALMKPDDDS